MARYVDGLVVPLRRRDRITAEVMADPWFDEMTIGTCPSTVRMFWGGLKVELRAR